jgi:hypothetical protein
LAAAITIFAVIGNEGASFAERAMPRYHFKLVDSRSVADYGVHELADDERLGTKQSNLPARFSKRDLT